MPVKIGNRPLFDPGCVETLRGISAPGILSPVVTRRARKRKNLSSARHYDQIRFRFRTAKAPNGSRRPSETGANANAPVDATEVEFAERDLWNVLLEAGSLRLDAGGPDHLTPLLGFVGDELAELGR